MAATNEDLAKAVEGNAPFLATCLRNTTDDFLAKMCREKLEKALNESDPEKLLAAASDTVNRNAVRAVEIGVKQAAKAISSVWNEQCAATSEMDNINTDDYRSLKKINIWAKWTLSILIVVGFFTVIILQYSGLGAPSGSKEQLALLIGALIAAFTAVVQYFFGSSVGSAEKSLVMQSKDAQVTATSTPAPVSRPVTGPSANPVLSGGS